MATKNDKAAKAAKKEADKKAKELEAKAAKDKAEREAAKKKADKERAERIANGTELKGVEKLRAKLHEKRARALAAKQPRI